MKRPKELLLHILGGGFDLRDLGGALIYLGAELAALLVLVVVFGAIGAVISILL